MKLPISGVHCHGSQSLSSIPEYVMSTKALVGKAPFLSLLLER